MNFSFNSILTINLRHEEYNVYIKIKQKIQNFIYLITIFLCTNNLSLMSINKKNLYNEKRRTCINFFFFFWGITWNKKNGRLIFMRQISTYLNFNIYATQESIHFKKHLIRSLSRYFNNPHNKLSFDGSSKNRVPKKVSSDTGGIKSLRAGRDSVSSVTCPSCVSFTYRHRSSSGDRSSALLIRHLNTISLSLSIDSWRSRLSNERARPVLSPSFLWRRLSYRASRSQCKKFYWQFEGVRTCRPVAMGLETIRIASNATPTLETRWFITLKIINKFVESHIR